MRKSVKNVLFSVKKASYKEAESEAIVCDVKTTYEDCFAGNLYQLAWKYPRSFTISKKKGQTFLQYKGKPLYKWVEFDYGHSTISRWTRRATC